MRCRAPVRRLSVSRLGRTQFYTHVPAFSCLPQCDPARPLQSPPDKEVLRGESHNTCGCDRPDGRGTRLRHRRVRVAKRSGSRRHHNDNDWHDRDEHERVDIDNHADDDYGSNHDHDAHNHDDADHNDNADDHDGTHDHDGSDDDDNRDNDDNSNNYNRTDHDHDGTDHHHDAHDDEHFVAPGVRLSSHGLSEQSVRDDLGRPARRSRPSAARRPARSVRCVHDRIDTHNRLDVDPVDDRNRVRARPRARAGRRSTLSTPPRDGERCPGPEENAGAPRHRVFPDDPD